MPEPTKFDDLYQQAVARWGQERADAIRQNLERLADHIQAVSAHLPAREEEPAFYM